MSLWHIDRLGHRGDGIAISEGRRALAALTLPGEEIEGDVQDGRIVSPRILTPSPDRVKPACRHYRSCGGCLLMHASEEFTSHWKTGVVEAALTAQGLEAPVTLTHVSPPRSRRRAVLSGRRTKKGALLGFHARASGIIVDLQECQVLHPAIMQALPILRRIVTAGASRSAELGMTVIHGPEGLDVAVAGGKPLDSALFHHLAQLGEAGDLARLDWDGQAITRRPPALPIGRSRLIPPPGAFLQATAEAEAALLAAVCRMTAGARKIVDLFAGCGTFTLPLAEAAQVHAVEGLAAPLGALDAAWRSAKGLQRVTTEIRDLARRPLQAGELRGFDAIVIDPPRNGAEAQAREIANSGVSRVAFIACDPVNFARDAKILTSGGYILSKVEVIDQFRWSPHVETVAEFQLR
ncbi:class I SAM-dependent RNA methyltransferase [Paracoccus onubensis]|uniref:class I SAM-dependent RNA methyltransferase n=1 Tax=Paracoccus onubensis TaxID=1675788 RepID=UPI0027310F48|nr:class I SAM-dependent RNA methyltransferase [Paracoccus onubensis]MDP0927088.1 class I SAM-dependent RNA methyltransferase [Paracoccus onubensis]